MARRLIALEARGPAEAAVRACDKLRAPLSTLAGVAGFRSLMGRALVLATAEVPALKSVRLGPDGALEGFAAAVPEADADAAGTAIVAQLLGLLVTFIGEPLTLRLVRDAWPEAHIEDVDRRAEGQP